MFDWSYQLQTYVHAAIKTRLSWAIDNGYNVDPSKQADETYKLSAIQSCIVSNGAQVDTLALDVSTINKTIKALTKQVEDLQKELSTLKWFA